MALPKIIPDEIKVRILNMVFLSDTGTLQVDDFMSFASYVYHPMLQTSSGVKDLAAQIIFNQQKINMDMEGSKAVLKGRKLPDIVTYWMKDLTIEWPGVGLPGGPKMYKALLSCRNLERLGLIIDFSGIDTKHPTALSSTMGMKKLLDCLPMKCKVTITSKSHWVPGTRVGGRVPDGPFRNEARDTLQAEFDSRALRVDAVQGKAEEKRQALNLSYRIGGKNWLKYRQNRNQKRISGAAPAAADGDGGEQETDGEGGEEETDGEEESDEEEEEQEEDNGEEEGGQAATDEEEEDSDEEEDNRYAMDDY